LVIHISANERGHDSFGPNFSEHQLASALTLGKQVVADIVSFSRQVAKVRAFPNSEVVFNYKYVSEF
jgi:hypothetical protein